MNYIKLQQDLIKELINKPTRKTFVRIGKYNDDIAIVTEHSVYMIPKQYFYLDYEVVMKELPEIEERVIKGFIPDKLEDVTKTNDIKLIANRFRPKKLDKVQRFNINNVDECLYIDVNKLKYFNCDDYIYKGYKNNAPLFLYRDEHLEGFVLPVKLMK